MLLLISAVDAIRKDYRNCVKPHSPLLFPQLQSSVGFTVLVLSATMIGKTSHASIIIRQMLSFTVTGSVLPDQNVFF